MIASWQLCLKLVYIIIDYKKRFLKKLSLVKLTFNLETGQKYLKNFESRAINLLLVNQILRASFNTFVGIITLTLLLKLIKA